MMGCCGRRAASSRVSDLSRDESTQAWRRTQSKDSGVEGVEEDALKAKDACVKKTLHLLDRLVIPETNVGRQVWDIILVVMLVYIGIIFPYMIAFFHFRLREIEDVCTDYEEPLPWYIWEELVFWFFWVDLLLNFFLTFRRDSDNEEEFRWKEIAKRYVTRLFVVNLVACLPAEAFAPLAYLLSDEGGCSTSSDGNQAVRLARLQRATRLARLARLTRLFKIASFMRKDSGPMGFRGLRMFNWIIFLFWVVHLMACGWYICAALHNDHSQTWVARRTIDADGEYSLRLAEPTVQYAHSFYFVLTVFTTVGFGDMSAMTTGEIGYVSLTMIIGMVVNSIVIGEVINLVGEVDLDTKWRKQQSELLEAYGQHACLSSKSVKELTEFVVHKLGTRGRTYDDAAVRTLMTTEAIPRRLLGAIPGELFNGLLIKNKLMTTCTRGSLGGVMPPRFAILLSTMLKSQRFGSGDMVYQEGDNSFTLYLVLSGTFAFVGEAHEGGGMDACPFPDDRTLTFAASKNRKRAVLEGATSHSHEDTTILNPPESERQYSGSACNWQNFSSLGQCAGAWTPGDTGGPHWIIINLAAVRSVCGVVVQGNPRQNAWVTEFTVRVAKRQNGPWVEVATACPGGRGEMEVTFQTQLAKYVRIEPTAWHGQIAMRAGVVVRTPKLYPYQIFGKLQFFGHEMLLKPEHSPIESIGTVRRSSARCEEAGELLQLHKNHLLPDGELGGDSLLAEFPQFIPVLREECLKRDCQRRRMLQKFTVELHYREFAAASIQTAWRKAKSGGNRRHSALGRVVAEESDAAGSRTVSQDLSGTVDVARLKEEMQALVNSGFAGLGNLRGGQLEQLHAIVSFARRRGQTWTSMPRPEPHPLLPSAPPRIPEQAEVTAAATPAEPPPPLPGAPSAPLPAPPAGEQDGGIAAAPLPPAEQAGVIAAATPAEPPAPSAAEQPGVAAAAGLAELAPATSTPPQAWATDRAEPAAAAAAPAGPPPPQPAAASAPQYEPDFEDSYEAAEASQQPRCEATGPPAASPVEREEPPSEGQGQNLLE